MTSYDLSDGHEPVSWVEIDYLKNLARRLPENPVIVNIGAATGVSTVAFLEERPDATIYSVDIEECPQELEHVRQAGLDGNRVIRVLGRSQHIGPTWGHPCDLLFIDGDHWDAGGDLEAWVMTGKVVPGGIVALHDFIKPPCPANNPGDVYNQVQAWHAAHPEFAKIGQRDRVIAFAAPVEEA